MTEPDSEKDKGATPVAPMGQRLSQGFLWMMLTTAVGKISALAGQIVLGWLLFEDDWGLYALALSVAAFVQILRDGGLNQLIVQRGVKAYPDLSGPAFWMASAFNLVAATLLLMAGPVAASIYGQPDLTAMLSVMALALVCGTPAVILRAKLQLDLNFRSLAWIGAATSIIRWGLTIGLAAAGAGVMSFMWAMLAAAIADSLLTWFITRDVPWARRPQVRQWPPMIRSVSWILLGSLATGLAMRGDYLVLGLLVSVTVLGQYTFGYELTAQLGLLLAVNFQSVLFPGLNRIVAEPRRFAEAAQRAIGVLILLASASSLLLAVAAPSVELLLWGGKWSAAVPVMQIFAVVVPLREMATVPHAIMLAQGRFATRTFLLSIQAAILMAAAFAGGAVFGSNLIAITMVIGASQALFSLIMMSYVVDANGADLGRLLHAVVVPWLLAFGCAAAISVLDTTLWSHLSPVPRLMIVTTAYTASLHVLARLFLKKQLHEVLALLPKTAHNVYRAVMLLPRS